MDIAVVTIMVLTFLLPGILFRRFYYTGEFSKEFFKSNFSDFILLALVPTIVINLSIGCFFYILFDTNIITSLIIIFQFVSGTHSTSFINTLLLTKIYQSSIYLISTFISACISGILLKFVIRYYGLDKRYKFFRFKNEWHYLFSGEILEITEASNHSFKSAKEIDLKYVDILQLVGNQTVIYSGILYDYVLSDEQGIDRLYIINAERKSFNKKDSSNTNYVFPGHILTVPYKNIQNIHITYYSIPTDIKSESTKIQNE